jgi:Domain of unknown function (DUF1707)
VVAELERHTTAGRLTLDEYTERVDSALAARTHGELGAVVADLPPETTAAITEPAFGSDDRRHLLLAFLIAALVVVVFAVALGLAR